MKAVISLGCWRTPSTYTDLERLNGMAPVSPVREKLPERGRSMVRINDERFHAGGDEMIERKSNERFLKNRNERLRKFVG